MGSVEILTAEEMKKQPVIAASCPDYSEENARRAVDECILGMGGLDWVKNGMTIAIKVNLVTGADPEKGATTSPQLVKAICRRLTERGARVVIGDSPGGIYTAPHVNSVYRACRMEEALTDGAALNGDFSVSKAFFGKAVSLRTFQYTGWLDEADAVINFAKLKTHGMMAMSCSVKNLFGTIPGTVKPEYHMRFPDTDAFADMLVDLNEYFRPVFNFVDGVIAMEGNGPTAGTPRKMGVVLASRSPYNLDAVCADLIGLELTQVPTIRAAGRRGLGPEKISEVKTQGNPEKYKVNNFRLVTRKLDVTFQSGNPVKNVLFGLARGILATKPMPVLSKCVGCGKCSRVCPAKAITMKNKRPKIDRSKCIHCFCCQEFCPKGAMIVFHNPIGLLVEKVNTAGAEHRRRDRNP